MTTLFRPILLLALAATLLASCTTLVGPRDIELPLETLQASLDRRFPMNNRMLELFEVELSRPQLSLQPQDGRVAIALDASVAPPFLRQSWRGSMALSGRLYIDPVRNAVMLAEPRVDNVALDGVDSARQRQFGKVASLFMKQVVLDIPLYHFRPQELRYAGVQFVPTRIATNARGLVVSVEPAK